MNELMCVYTCVRVHVCVCVYVCVYVCVCGVCVCVVCVYVVGGQSGFGIRICMFVYVGMALLHHKFCNII